MSEHDPMHRTPHPRAQGTTPPPLSHPERWLGEQIARALALSDNDIEFDRHRITLDPLGWLREKLR